jgi:SAM-dependent methyltransferase
MYPRIAPPTSLLPPLRTLLSLDIPDIAHALAGLRTIYAPLPRVSGFTHPPHNVDASTVDSGYASADEEDEPDPDVLRADPMERAFAIKWLTGFIARADGWTPTGTHADPPAESQRLLDDASALLASFTDPADPPGEDDTGAVTRTFAFARADPAAPPVALTLVDAPLLDTDHTAVGLQSWGASIIFGALLCADPARFGLDGVCRVLELGAGTGVLSMVAAQLLGARGTVVATDFHPAVLANLRTNIAANAPSVAVDALDWTAPDALDAVERFDVLLAADVVYGPAHAALLRDCAERWLAPGGTFWLAATVRPSGRFAGVVDTLFSAFPSADKETREGRLVIRSVEDIGKTRGIGRADEDGYKLFNIAWRS